MIRKRLLRGVSSDNLAIIFYIIAFIITASFQFYALELRPFMDIRVSCAEYFNKGELYTGQPACVEGPVSYWFFALIDRFFPTNQQIATLMFNYILFAILFFLLLNILKKEKVLYSRFLLLLSYLIFFIIMVGNESVALYTTFFLFLGVYRLVYGKNYRYISSAILFSLAIHTKMIAVPFLFVFIILYFFYKAKEWMSVAKFVLVFAMVFSITSIILEILFPGLFLYTIFWHFKLDPVYEHSFENALISFKFLTTNIFADNIAVYPIGPYMFNNTYFIPAINFFVLFYLIFSIFLFFNKKHFFSLFNLFGFLLFFVILSYKYYNFRFRYFIPVLPFFIFAVNSTYNRLSSRFGKKIFFALFVVLTYSAVMSQNKIFMTNTEKFESFQQESAIALQFIPKDFYLLMDSTDIFTAVGIELNKSRYWLYPEAYPYPIDDWNAVLFEDLGILNPMFSDWRDVPYRNKTVIERRIKSGFYDAIILSNMNLGSLAVMLINNTHPYNYSLFFPKINEQCINCQFQGVIFLKNETEYEMLRDRVGAAYGYLYSRLCKKDGVVVDHILYVLLEDGIFIPVEECYNRDDYFRRATGEGIINSASNIYVFAFIVLFLLYLFNLVIPNE